MVKGKLAGIIAMLAIAFSLAAAPAGAAQKDIKWGTGPVGSAGYKALVVLAGVINKALPEYNISVLPTPGAVVTIKGYTVGDYDGDYVSDVALKELNSDTGRFQGFKANIKRPPIQSFWCYTLDVGLAVKATDRTKFKKWEDLTGQPVFTGPLPFDTRKYLEDAMAAVGVKHIYKQVDLETVGSQLDSGTLKGMTIYAAGGETPAPWLSEASLSVDWAALNPSPDEMAKLKAKGFKIEEVDPKIFGAKNTYTKKVVLLPFYWGFDLGPIVTEDEMFKILNAIEAHADELANLDPGFHQIGGGKMAAFEKEALSSTWNLAPIHPGLAKWMKSKGVWDKKWDANVAKM